MEIRTENLCQICGDIGFPELVVTCSKCRTAREHPYCMRVNINKVPENWVCEACALCEDVELPIAERRERLQNVQPSVIKRGGFTGLCGNLRRHKYAEKLKAVTTGKVRFLPVEEVVRLTSSATKKVPPKKVVRNFGDGCGSSSMKFSRPDKKPRIRTIVADLAKPTGQDKRMQMSSPTNQRAPNKPKDERTSTAKEIQKVEMNMKSAANKEPHAPPVGGCSPPFTCKDDNFRSFTESKTVHVEEGDPLNILPKLRLYLPHLPSPNAAWKGAFEILDASTTDNLYDGVEAKRPSMVHIKAYQFSKRMPSVLQVELLPRCSVWVDLFVNDLPDFLDIALYFFPSANTGRSRARYDSLFELMETQDSMMRSYIDGGVELLIFTSRQLQADAQDVTARLGIKHFLWGLFRRVKEENNLLNELPLTVSSSERDGMDGGGGDDMEIDMVGGQDRGRVDVIIPKPNSKRVYSESVNSVKSTAQRDSESVVQQIHSTSEQAESSNSQLFTKFSQNINSGSTSLGLSQGRSLGTLSCSTEETGIIMPGFEEMLKLKSGDMLLKGKDKDMGFYLNDAQATNFVEKGSIGLPVAQNDTSLIPLSHATTQEDEQDLREITKLQFVSTSREAQECRKASDGKTVNLSRMGDIDIQLPEKIDRESVSAIPLQSSAGKFSQAQEKSKLIHGKIMSKTNGNTDKNVRKLAEKGSIALPRVTGNGDTILQSLPMEVQAPPMQEPCWRPPPTGWVKLNVVGKSKWDVGVAGASGIIRDEYCRWVVGYTLNLAKCMGLATELWAVFQGLMFTWERGYRNVLVESESHVMLECLRKPPSLNDPNRDLINCCLNLIQREWDCRFYYTQREANTCAHYLATHFEHRPMGLTTFHAPPVDMVPILQNDSMIAAAAYQPSFLMAPPFYY